MKLSMIRNRVLVSEMTSKEKMMKNHIIGSELHCYAPVVNSVLTSSLFIRYMEENPNAGVVGEESDNEIEYDEDGNPLAPKKSKVSVNFYIG